MLLCTTELHTRADHDHLIEALKEVGLMYRQARYEDRSIFELDRGGGLLPEEGADPKHSPARGHVPGREVSPDLPEREVVMHYTNLSQMNFGVDNGFYPLGWCTMKYNPKYATNGHASVGRRGASPRMRRRCKVPSA